MSTFEGVVAEFPDIRIDYFRPSSSEKPALAYFLSHVHSDHLVGLESCKSPFIYCSPATRDILLRLEKYPHRMNFAKGILETRKQTYRHLKNLLKAIPLECPTEIELSPGNSICATLFDANHCVGAVSFLIEGQGHAVLYTGDVRCEPWWINALIRNPIILPYIPSSSSGARKRLDCVYLDTTFVISGKDDPFISFPTKASGLDELLENVARYPKDTLFYLDAWTFGYEDVWQTLSNFLDSKIHVDDYRYGLYRSLANGTDPKAPEAAKLIGFQCGNHFQDGCLTTNTVGCRIHSCEKGTGCEIWSQDFVRITPIVSRHQGMEIAELGAGGGHGDLNQRHELDTADKKLMSHLLALCTSKLSDQPQLLAGVLQMLATAMSDGVQTIQLDDFAPVDAEMTDIGDIAIDKVVTTLAKSVAKNKLSPQTKSMNSIPQSVCTSKRLNGLPTQITFPYSRHSSYNELLKLITCLKPRDIHPCTVDEARWTPASSMSFLFGHIYATVPMFSHDQMMLKKTIPNSAEMSGISRHGSSGSPPSRYETPPELNSKPITATKRGREVDEESEQESENDDNYAAKHRDRRNRRQDCDNWPPTEIDHYSPPRWERRRASSISARPDYIHTNGGLSRPLHTRSDDVSNRPRQRSWQERLAVDGLSTSRQVQTGRSESSRASRQPLAYGRLSPPPTRQLADRSSSHDERNSIPRQGSNTRELQSRADFHQTLSSSPAANRLAFRQEVYDALQGNDDNPWYLASVNGHQVKEEEL